jgi:hypothetical protein
MKRSKIIRINSKSAAGRGHRAALRSYPGPAAQAAPRNVIPSRAAERAAPPTAAGAIRQDVHRSVWWFQEVERAAPQRAWRRWLPNQRTGEQCVPPPIAWLRLQTSDYSLMPLGCRLSGPESPLFGRELEALPEQPVELRDIAKTAGKDDAGHGVFPLGQQTGSVGQTKVGEVFPKRATAHLLKKRAKMATRHSGPRRRPVEIPGVVEGAFHFAHHRRHACEGSSRRFTNRQPRQSDQKLRRHRPARGDASGLPVDAFEHRTAPSELDVVLGWTTQRNPALVSPDQLAP